MITRSHARVCVRSKFDLFAGVSGGSINAAMLATGIKPELMAEIQKFMAPAVFGKGKRQATLELKGLSLRRAKYSADPLLILGEELFQGPFQSPVVPHLLHAR
jgi:predicted acylesterase/phospholipase RssA